MSFSIEIIRKEEQSTSSWAGGTTTQLAIYPKTSDYKERNFIWRLSSARVEIEESTFTSLPGIWRHIMILDGELTLSHEGHHSALLKPLEQDSFSGGWTTKSIGKVKDFNLMLAEGSKGQLEAIRIGKGEAASIAAYIPESGFNSSADTFYCAAGEILASFDGSDVYSLAEGDLMIVYGNAVDVSIPIGLHSKEYESAVVRAKILYNS